MIRKSWNKFWARYYEILIRDCMDEETIEELRFKATYYREKIS